MFYLSVLYLVQRHNEMHKLVSSINPPESGDPGSDRESESHLSIRSGRSFVSSGGTLKDGTEKGFKQASIQYRFFKNTFHVLTKIYRS